MGIVSLRVPTNQSREFLIFTVRTFFPTDLLILLDVQTLQIVRQVRKHARLGSDDQPSGRYAIHYKISYERNFVIRIFVKRGLTGIFQPKASV
jgi:hypothetical protein